MQLLSRKTAVICEEFCALRFGSIQVVKLISWKQNATIQNVRNTVSSQRSNTGKYSKDRRERTRAQIKSISAHI